MAATKEYSYLGNGVIPEVHAGVEGEEGRRPGQKSEEMPRAGRRDAGPVEEAEEREVAGEEEHVLGVTRGPSVGVADLESSAHRGGARLLDRGLDEFVEHLGEKEAKGEEHALKLPAKDEVGYESAETDEDRDERDPR